MNQFTVLMNLLSDGLLNITDFGESSVFDKQAHL